MICSPERSGLFCGGLFVRAQIENAAEHRRADDDRIADKAQRVRDLAEDEKAPERRIDDLRIIKHGDLLRRGVAVRGGNGKLSSGRGAAGQQQKDPLLRAHRLKVESEELTIYYDMQCPYIYQRIEMVKQYCEINNVPVSLIQVDTLEKAKNLPCVFNNWGVFYKGNFETVNLLLDVEHLKRILKK